MNEEKPAAGVSRRIVEADVLRGFALFGILVVNSSLMAGPYTGLGGGPEASSADRVAAWMTTALFSGKFYLLFSFLFGYSFVLQERAAHHAGAAFASRHLRRTAALFAIGAVHAVLLFPGDVLTTYAVLALVLYGLRGLSPRAAVRGAAGLILVLAALLLGYGLLTVAFTEPLEPSRYAYLVAGTVDAYQSGFLSVPKAHLMDLPSALGADLLYAPDMLAAFLAGLGAARYGLIERKGRDFGWLRRTATRFLPVGLTGGVLTACCATWPMDSRWFYVGQAVSVLTAPALTVSYACGLLLLLNRMRPAAAMMVAASGRMALTHYLTQSLVLAVVFTGYGCGLYNQVGRGVVLVGCVPLYAAQLICGAQLMRVMRYGPVESLLRVVTLGRRLDGSATEARVSTSQSR